MSYSYSISSNPAIKSKTYGIDKTVKTNNGNNLNLKMGLTLEDKNNGPFKSKTGTLQAANLTLSSKNENTKVGLSAAKISGTAGASIGGGVGISGKAAITEVESSHTFNIGSVKVKISGEIGIGIAAGTNVGISSNKVSIGGKTMVMKGLYLGGNIDISF